MKGVCSVCPSEKNVRLYQKKKPFCGKHREQMRRFGRIRERTLATGNEYIDRNTHIEMRIFDRKLKLKGIALIDHDDKEKVSAVGSWCIDPQGYVINGKEKIKLHQLILGKKPRREIDHRNGNKVDNRKVNLEHVTHSENVHRWWLRRHLASGKTADSFFEELLPPNQ